MFSCLVILSFFLQIFYSSVRMLFETEHWSWMENFQGSSNGLPPIWLPLGHISSLGYRHRMVQIIKHRITSSSTVTSTVTTTQDKVAHPINIILFYQSSSYTGHHYIMHINHSQGLPQYILCKLTKQAYLKVQLIFNEVLSHLFLNWNHLLKWRVTGVFTF